MSLRARLLVSTAGLLSVALLVTGALLVGFTRANLIDQVDAELRTAGLDDVRAVPGGNDAEAGRRIAVMLLGPDGTVLSGLRSGFRTRPDPLPVLPTYRGTIPVTAYGVITTRSSADGTVPYRVIVQRGRRSTIIAIAAPLSGVDAATGSIARNLVLVGGAAIAAVVLVGWVVIRRDLRPLERFATAADRIAAGDLSQRSGVAHDRSEVGRLGAAFDQMLDRIQNSFQGQQAALDGKDVSERQLRQFVADASHELRTPLTAVRGYADLYRAGGLAERSALDNAMSRIGTESQRMGALVEDLLLLARLDQGRPLRADAVNLTTVVEDAVADAVAIEPDRPIIADLARGVTVQGDEDRLRQVVGTLLANVRVHTPPRALVRVSLIAEAGRPVLRVADHGPGIDPINAERVFDRFFRVDPARSRDRGGSGLGLSIASSVAGALGGTLTHEPTPGGGATFVLRLPARDGAH